MHRMRGGIPARLVRGLIRPLDSLPSDLTKTPPTVVNPAASREEKSTIGPVLRSNMANHLSVLRVRSSRWRISLLPPSMKRAALQIFLTRSDKRSFNSPLVSFEAMS